MCPNLRFLSCCHNMKNTLKRIHRWLGLATGLPVFVIAITGCLYAFQAEIQDLTQPYRFVQTEDKSPLLPSKLREIALAQLPGKELHSIKYHRHGRAAEAIFYHYEPTYYYILYLNPYSGEVLQLRNMEKGFFPFILRGHFYLWLPPAIGQPVVASITLLFIALLLSGLAVWLPKNARAIAQKMKFHWKDRSSWKRKNYDLHTLAGVYTLLIALVFALTGLVWGFSWFADGLHKVLGGTKPLEYQEPVASRCDRCAPQAMDALYLRLIGESPWSSIEVHPPAGPQSPVAISINSEAGTYWKTDYRYFDPQSLAELPTDNLYGRLADAGTADKLLRMNYDLHTGAVWGLGGKIFMFLMSLLIASLPVTGFAYWYGRRVKKAWRPGRAGARLLPSLEDAAPRP